jgi:hypothetical protein
MISLTKKTKLQPEEVIKRTITFFGPKGFGLKIEEQEENYVYLEGGGGGVRVTVAAGDKGTTVDLESREWEIQSKNFLASLK